MLSNSFFLFFFLLSYLALESFLNTKKDMSRWMSKYIIKLVSITKFYFLVAMNFIHFIPFWPYFSFSLFFYFLLLNWLNKNVCFVLFFWHPDWELHWSCVSFLLLLGNYDLEYDPRKGLILLCVYRKKMCWTNVFNAS